MSRREIVAWVLVLLLIVALITMYKSMDQSQNFHESKIDSETIQIQEIENLETKRKQELERAEEERKVILQIRKEFSATVTKCASIVRSRTDSKTFKGLSKFDAYVPDETREHVKYFGTDDERFQFEKCMANNKQLLSN